MQPINVSEEVVRGQKESAAGMTVANPVAGENPSQPRLQCHPPPCCPKDSSGHAFWDLASAVEDLDTWLRLAERSQCILLVSLW